MATYVIRPHLMHACTHLASYLKCVSMKPHSATLVIVDNQHSEPGVIRLIHAIHKKKDAA